MRQPKYRLLNKYKAAKKNFDHALKINNRRRIVYWFKAYKCAAINAFGETIYKEFYEKYRFYPRERGGWIETFKIHRGALRIFYEQKVLNHICQIVTWKCAFYKEYRNLKKRHCIAPIIIKIETVLDQNATDNTKIQSGG